MEQLATKLIDEVIEREGGYVDHPHDRGGKTNFGITEAVAREHGYMAHMRDLSRSMAVNIYYTDYWLKVNLQNVCLIYPRVAAELFDTAVNMGTVWAGRFLQDALNVLMDAQLRVDGKIGPKTLNKLRDFKQVRGALGESVLVKLLDCFQGERYATLVRNDEKQRSFIIGWLNRRIGNA